MSLQAQAAANIANYVYADTAETLLIVESRSKSQKTTNEDRGIDPATGKTVLYGNHNNEETAISLSGIALTAGGVAGNVGNTVTLLSSTVVGSGRSNGTNVITGIDVNKDNAGGKFQRVTLSVINLPF